MRWAGPRRDPRAIPGAGGLPAEVLAGGEGRGGARRPTMSTAPPCPSSRSIRPSTDLDQAFAIEAAAGDLLLHYAIADVAWFVDDGGAIDAEAWRRGATHYLPDGKAGLYPPVLSEGAASLLPDGPRPAMIFTVRVVPTARPARRRRAGDRPQPGQARL